MHTLLVNQRFYAYVRHKNERDRLAEPMRKPNIATPIWVANPQGLIWYPADLKTQNTQPSHKNLHPAQLHTNNMTSPKKSSYSSSSLDLTA